MAEVLVFHHALGRTEGVEAFGNALGVAGHDVTVPDLFEGELFDSIDAGVAHAESIGFDVIAERGARCADDAGEKLVVIGFSLGVLPAQKIAQTRPGVVGAVLCHSAVPLSFFGPSWPEGVAAQLHMGARDPFVEEDRAAIDELLAVGAEFFEYDTAAHLVTDATSPDYNAGIAAQIVDRVLALLARVS